MLGVVVPGPAPSKNPRRRNARPDTLVLPASGRPGSAPEWPLSGKPPTSWYELWRLPQAVAWERLSLERVVARYCRVLVAAERVTAPAALLAEVRQMEDRLGLSAMAMARLHWEVKAVEDKPADSEGTVTSLDEWRDALG